MIWKDALMVKWIQDSWAVEKSQKRYSLRTLAPTRISEEVGKFLRDGHLMLCECVSVKPDVPAFYSMAVHNNLFLISRRNLLPPSNMLKFASLIGFGASFIVETKEAAILLRQIQREQLVCLETFFAMENTSLGEIFCPNSGLEFFLLGTLSRAGVVGGEASGFNFLDRSRPPWSMDSITLEIQYLRFVFLGINLGITSMWLSRRSENLATSFTTFWMLVVMSFAPSSPSSIKLLLTEFVESLPTEPRLDAAYLKTYAAIVGRSRTHWHASGWNLGAWSSWLKPDKAMVLGCQAEYQRVL